MEHRAIAELGAGQPGRDPPARGAQHSAGLLWGVAAGRRSRVPGEGLKKATQNRREPCGPKVGTLYLVTCQPSPDAHHDRPSQARPRRPSARPGLRGPTQRVGRSVCGGEEWQPGGGDRQIQAVAVGKAPGARFTSRAGAAAAVGQSGGWGAGVVVLVPPLALPCGGGAVGVGLVGGGAGIEGECRRFLAADDGSSDGASALGKSRQRQNVQQRIACKDSKRGR